MESPTKSQPLLQEYSDNEDEGSSRIRRRNIEPSDQIDNESESDTPENELTTDECDDTESLFKVANPVPNDRFSFTYVVFYLLGMTTLLPWNFFVTAEDVCITLSSTLLFPAIALANVFWRFIFHMFCVT